MVKSRSSLWKHKFPWLMVTPIRDFQLYTNSLLSARLQASCRGIKLPWLTIHVMRIKIHRFKNLSTHDFLPLSPPKIVFGVALAGISNIDEKILNFQNALCSGYIKQLRMLYCHRHLYIILWRSERHVKCFHKSWEN